MIDISDEALESVRQLTDTWEAFVKEHPGSDVRDVAGLSIRWANSAFAFWNCLTFTDRGADRQLLDERLAQGVAYMRDRNEPGLIWIFEDLLDPSARVELPAAAERAGLVEALRGYGMAGDILPIPEPHHPDLEFVRVTTEEQLVADADASLRHTARKGTPWLGRLDALEIGHVQLPRPQGRRPGLGSSHHPDR